MTAIKRIVVGKEYELQYHLPGLPATDRKVQDGSGPTELAIGPYDHPGEIILAESLLGDVYGQYTLFNYYREDEREQKGNHFHSSEGRKTTPLEYYGEGVIALLFPNLSYNQKHGRFRNTVLRWAYLGLVPFAAWENIDSLHPYLYVCLNRKNHKHTTENRLSETSVTYDVLRLALGILLVRALAKEGHALWDQGKYGAGWVVPHAVQDYVITNHVKVLPKAFLDAAAEAGWLADIGKELHKQVSAMGDRVSTIPIDAFSEITVPSAVVYTRASLLTGSKHVLDPSAVLPALDEQINALPKQWRLVGAIALLWLSGAGDSFDATRAIKQLTVATLPRPRVERVYYDIINVIFGGAGRWIPFERGNVYRVEYWHRAATRREDVLPRVAKILHEIPSERVRDALLDVYNALPAEWRC